MLFFPVLTTTPTWTNSYLAVSSSLVINVGLSNDALPGTLGTTPDNYISNSSAAFNLSMPLLQNGNSILIGAATSTSAAISINATSTFTNKFIQCFNQNQNKFTVDYTGDVTVGRNLNVNNGVINLVAGILSRVAYANVSSSGGLYPGSSNVVSGSYNNIIGSYTVTLANAGSNYPVCSVTLINNSGYVYISFSSPSVINVFITDAQNVPQNSDFAILCFLN